jgi:hypothetical protein
MMNDGNEWILEKYFVSGIMIDDEWKGN